LGVLILSEIPTLRTFMGGAVIIVLVVIESLMRFKQSRDS